MQMQCWKRETWEMTLLNNYAGQSRTSSNHWVNRRPAFQYLYRILDNKLISLWWFNCIMNATHQSTTRNQWVSEKLGERQWGDALNAGISCFRAERKWPLKPDLKVCVCVCVCVFYITNNLPPTTRLELHNSSAATTQQLGLSPSLIAAYT